MSKVQNIFNELLTFFLIRFDKNFERLHALKFLKDGSFSDLKNALEAKDGERAFRAAHTLKGVCINLGFDRLYNVSAELTEKLRGREIEESEELFEQVEKEYHVLTAVLKQYESEL